MSTPTQDQIQTVQSNLMNMIAFNDYIHSYGKDKILNAYLLLTEPDQSDPGLTVVLNVMEGAFWAIGSEGGPIGNFAASFLSGMLSYWATDTPPDLNGAFADYLSRFSTTCGEVGAQLAVYHSDVAGNWDTTFTYNGSQCSLSDLSTINFPTEGDNLFTSMRDKALFALDQNVWTYMFVSLYVITLWEQGMGLNVGGDKNTPPVDWVQSFYQHNPAYYCTWQWHDSSGCGDESGWIITEYNIGTGAGVFTDGSLNNDSCNYIFIDSTPGAPLNANGLFTRQDVFTNLGIRQTTYDVGSAGANSGNGKRQLSVAYLRAMKEGKTLGKLIEKVGRSEVEKRLLQQAASDPFFAHNLAMRPRPTLEKFLEVKIPEVLDLNITVENGRNFGLVIPKPNYLDF
jgi:hypothetical protein